jgi:AAA15 family ATPase/GTPase
MYISKIRVKDYKSFRDSGDIEFKPGINLIVGQNNAGKTTLLEALEMRFETIHHRSLKNPKDEVNYKNPSEINFSLELSVDDLSELSRNSLDSNYRIPFPYKIIEHINPEKKFIYNRFE